MSFRGDVADRLDAMQLSLEDPQRHWAVFQNAVHSSTVDTQGNTSRRHQDWFDEYNEEIQECLEENTAHTRLIKMILAQDQRGQPTTTSVRQSTADRDMQDFSDEQQHF